VITINFFNPNNFEFNKTLIKNSVIKVFQDNFINNAETSIAMVNTQEMTNYAKKYLNENEETAKSHPVLSFLKSEVKKPFIEPPDQINHIGEIIISYDKAIEYSKNSGKSIDQEIASLAKHAALHLCGIHHS